MNTNNLSGPLSFICKKIWGFKLSAVPQGSANRGAPVPAPLSLLTSRPPVSRLVKAPALPPEYQLYVAQLRVDVPYHRRAAAQAFAQGSDLAIELDAGGADPYNAAAIKVIGVDKSRRSFIGFMPSDITAKIAASGLRNHIRVQLDHISQGADGFITVSIQVIVPEALGPLSKRGQAAVSPAA